MDEMQINLRETDISNSTLKMHMTRIKSAQNMNSLQYPALLLMNPVQGLQLLQKSVKEEKMALFQQLHFL